MRGSFHVVWEFGSDFLEQRTGQHQRTPLRQLLAQPDSVHRRRKKALKHADIRCAEKIPLLG